MEAIALDTTGSSVVPVDDRLQPLDEYYLWCDHSALYEAQEITALAHARGLEAIAWCGGVYSHEWGWAKLLHWLRHNPDKREHFASAFEHCDMVAATLCGITDPRQGRRSACATGHKWLWNPRWDGYPPKAFFSELDPLLDGMRDRMAGEVLTSDRLAGSLAPEWASQLGLRAGVPIPVGAFDAHWDAIGAGCREGDVVNVVGTSTYIIAMTREVRLIPGVCGLVPGSVHPEFTGVEAGLSAVGDTFEAIDRRADTDVRPLSEGLERYHAGQTELLRLSWDNGDRTVLVKSELGGITLGWNLLHTAQDELFAAIEGTAFHTRIILERMAEYGVLIDRVINAGGIPQSNAVLNQVYANVLNKPVLVPDSPPTSIGSGIFAQLAAGIFPTIEAAQQRMCPRHRVFTPDAEAVAVYEQVYELYRRVYFEFGDGSATANMGDVLLKLRKIAANIRIHAESQAPESRFERSRLPCHWSTDASVSCGCSHPRSILLPCFCSSDSMLSAEFFLAAHEMSARIAGLGFVSAKPGIVEVDGRGRSSLSVSHSRYALALDRRDLVRLFLGIVMMPFYYISKTHAMPATCNCDSAKSDRDICLERRLGGFSVQHYTERMQQDEASAAVLPLGASLMAFGDIIRLRFPKIFGGQGGGCYLMQSTTIGM